MKKILVTGGAGFIGSHLCEALILGKNQVTVIDNLSTSSKSNISALLDDKHFTFYHDTVMNRPLLKRLIRTSDLVYHLAAAVGVKYIINNPVNSLLTNIKGTENVLEFCADYKRKVLITSTSEVYGKHICVPFKETDDLVLGTPDKLRWEYGASKIIDEFLGLAYYKERRLPVVIVRLFNTVGPRQLSAYGMVLPNFIKRALANKPLIVYGSGDQTRVFNFVADTVEGLVRLGKEKNAVGNIFNLGGSQSVSIAELAKKVKQRSGSRSEIIYIPYQKAYGKDAIEFEDVECRIPDLTKIKKLINYKPRYSINDIIDETIGYFKTRKG